MKVVLLLTLVSLTYARNFVPFWYEWPCYFGPGIEWSKTTGPGVSYAETYAIPMAEEIRKAEEQMKHGRITGGSPSTIGQFPYQVGVLIEYHHTNSTGVCGGVLVKSDRVITAAHCWHDGWYQAQRLTLVFGSVFLYSGGIRIQSSNVVMHPEFCAEPIRNDVAVVYLPVNVPFSDIISPVALPTGDELDMDFVGVTAVVSGYGREGNTAPISITQSLNHVTLTVISNDQCRDSFPWSLMPTNICTSSVRGVNPCIGDSGGPLVYTNNNRRVLIGIVSFGSGFGCEAGDPAAYARITSFMGFINEHITA